MTKSRYEAAGGYVIDWERERICSFGDPDSAAEAASRWNANDFRDEPEEYEWHFEHMPPAQPADCPDHYWAAPHQCMEVRDAIAREVAEGVDRLVIADWCQLFQYVFRVLRKGQPFGDLRKIEHYARILRERLEGGK